MFQPVIHCEVKLPYLVDDCQLIADSGCPHLCSAHANVLTVPRALDLATGVSRSRVREFGSVYLSHCGSLTLNLDTLNDFSRHFCLARLRRISNTLISMHRV